MLPDLILAFAPVFTFMSSALVEQVNTAVGHFISVFHIALSISTILQGEFALKKRTEQNDLC